MTHEDEEILEEMRRAIAARRPYAGFFHWPERTIAERGIVQTFCESAKDEKGLPFSNVRARPTGQDPPDCEALDSSGRPIAIEVTELVDGRTIALAKESTAVLMAQWNDDRIREQIAQRLLSKDRKTLLGGPYHEYLVLIHTDEPLLTSDRIGVALAGFTPPTVEKIDRAYILLSYDPKRQGYPYFRIL